MQIASATLEDARGIAEIHVASWQAAYAHVLPAEYLAGLSIDGREKWWRECITAGDPALLVAKTENAALGWINFGKSRDADAPDARAEVWAIYVSPMAWSSGVGGGLWLRAAELLVERGFSSCSLWVLSQNARAIAFYKGLGFVEDAVPPKKFELGGMQVEEVRYVKQLDG